MGSFTKRYCFSANQDLEPDLQVLKVQGRLCKGLQKVFREFYSVLGSSCIVRVLERSLGMVLEGDTWRAGL